MKLLRWISCAAMFAATVISVSPERTGTGTVKAQDQPAAANGGSSRIAYAEPSKATYLKIAGVTETMLKQDVIEVWFPRSVDQVNGGFNSGFTRDWQPIPSEGKFSVLQGRMVWTAAQLAMQRPELRSQMLPIIDHGMKYLSEKMWDQKYGGFYWGLDDKGQTNTYYSDGKHLYGMSFCLYASAAAYQATKNPKYLKLAQRSFHWMEEHAHDTKNGGYFEWLNREGQPYVAHPETGKVQPLPVALFPVGYKSMNTHIHLLESYTQLYEVWKDETLRARLEELLEITRDKVSVEPGAMNLYFTNDWKALPDHDSYGHDVEAGYLMLEAAAALGRAHDAKTERMAKMLVDHALAYGWDAELGGFLRDGTTFGKPEDRLKEWWVQFEGLNALLLMHEKYGRENDTYFKAFQKQWEFIKVYQIDSQYHGVYEMVGTDGKAVNDGKGRIWKGGYHDGRALLNVKARLEQLAKTAAN